MSAETENHYYIKLIPIVKHLILIICFTNLPEAFHVSQDQHPCHEKGPTIHLKYWRRVLCKTLNIIKGIINYVTITTIIISILVFIWLCVLRDLEKIDYWNIDTE